MSHSALFILGVIATVAALQAQPYLRSYGLPV